MGEYLEYSYLAVRTVFESLNVRFFKEVNSSFSPTVDTTLIFLAVGNCVKMTLRGWPYACNYVDEIVRKKS